MTLYFQIFLLFSILLLHPMCCLPFATSMFVNSGFLVTLLFFRAKTSTKSSNQGSFTSGAKQTILLVIYRYIRLTPVYFMVIIINAVTLK